MAQRKTQYVKDGTGKPGDSRELVKEKPQTAVTEFGDDDFAVGNEGLTSHNIIIPRLAVIQGLSPQIDSHSPVYIPEAKLGQICDVALGEVWDSIKIIPCYYADVYLEWAPRDSGEGLVRNYGTDSSAYDAIVPNELQQHILPNGNEIQETGTIYCLNLSAGGRPSFFPLSATRYKCARQFNSLRAEDRAQDKQGVFRQLRIMARVYDVTVAQTQNKKGKWYIPIFKRAELTKQFDPSHYLWEKALNFAQQVEEGLAVADYAREDPDPVGENERM